MYTGETMKKLLVLLATTLIAVSAMAQFNPKLSKPHAQTEQVTAMSASTSYDSSLFKTLFLFDKLDRSYTAFNYDVGQLDGLLSNPIRFGWAGAKQNEDTIWTGPALSYNLFQTDRFTLGLCAAVDGIKITNGTIMVDENMRLIPGVFFSVKFN
jgi:hypothetical protein